MLTWCLVAWAPAALFAAAPPQFDLFHDRAAHLVHAELPLGVMRSRAVGIPEQRLATLKTGDSVMLNLFHDASFPAIIDHARQTGPSTFHWEGRIDGNPLSSVLMVLHSGAVAGIIRAPGVGEFRVRSSAGRGQVVEEIDQAKFMPCATGAAQSIRAFPGQRKPPLDSRGAPVGTECTLIDVMIVYTAQARDLEGGTAEIEAIAHLAVDETNVAFVNSEITCRARLVFTGLVDYVESGDFVTEIVRLQDPTDTFMDEVHAIRDEYGADAVDLLVSHTQGGTICGIGYLMQSLDPAFEAFAFSVCNTGCAAGGFTFAHELGHNMGCHHDRQNAGSQGVFDFSYGYRFLGDNAQLYRTVMSYAPGNRISHFSNPDVSYQGQPTGVPEGHTDPNGDPDSADNARTINATSDTVAAFRFVPPGSTGPQEPHLWSPPQMAQPDELAAGDRFGCAVAMDGDLAIVGAYGVEYTDANPVMADAGAAYIYQFDPGTKAWQPLGPRLVAEDPHTNDRFGDAVAIHNKTAGTGFAVVGAYLADFTGARDSGAVYVFRGQTSGWTQEAKLRGNDLAGGDIFGRSVAAASTPMGDLILVGAYFHDNGATGSDNRGAAYLFRQVAGVWQQEAKLIASNAQPNDQFGISVALKISPIDGEQYALVGALNGDGAIPNTGSAYVFRWTSAQGGRWTEVATLTAPDADTNHQFGVSVALDIAETGKVALIGSRRPLGDITGAGAAYFFRDLGDKQGWMHEATVVSTSPGTNDRFGHHLAIKGSVALVGSYLDDPAPAFNDSGAAYVFRKRGGNWTTEARITAPNLLPGDHFGYRVALADGDDKEPIRAAIGAWQRPRDKNNTLVGALYFTDGLPLDDCNNNGVSDICDIAYETSADVNNNGIPDECENDCNGNGIPDSIDIATGTSQDINGNGLPDECDPDCNQNTVPDDVDIANGTSQDVNLNGIPDECERTPCPADITGDGVVNVNDLLQVINNWGACPAPPNPCPADITGDGVVNVNDLLQVINNWGACPP